MTLDRKRWPLAAFYLMATVQIAWCYLWLTRPYVNTALYEQDRSACRSRGAV